MKKLLALVTATLALASFKPLQAEPWEGFYVEGFGGANFLQSSKKSHRSSSSSSESGRRHKRKFDTGYYVGGALGYRMCSGLRFEGEISYRHNQLKKHHRGSESGRCGRGHLNNISYMANALYEIDTSCWDCCWSCGEIIPYFGAGIGYSQQKFKRGRRGSDSSDEGRRHGRHKGGFAWQLIAGLGYEIGCNADISIEYRFHKGHIKDVYAHGVGVAGKYHF